MEKLKTKHLVAMLEVRKRGGGELTTFLPLTLRQMPANLIVQYFVTHGPFYFGPHNPRAHFLLFGHLFPFSGIASSLLVGQFWSAFTESWPNVDEFVDPASKPANKRRTLLLIGTCVLIDVAFGLGQYLTSFYGLKVRGAS